MWGAYRWVPPQQRTDNYMHIFVSKMKRPKIIMRTNKTDKEGNITQEPLYIQFEDKVFQTEDEQIVEFLHSLKNFGYDYREVDAVPQ